MATRGVLLCCFWKVGYGYAAFNLAASLKHLSPSVPITLLCDATSVSHLDDHYKQVFDQITVMGDPIEDPGLFKVGIYDKLPYDYTLYLDVDGLCINPIEPLLDSLIADYEADPEGMFYRTHIHEWYDQHSPVDMPMMYWARRDVIWDTYQFTDNRLPGTQSSIQFIAKCQRAERFYGDLKHLMTYDYIPLEALRHKWGGTQPDELYLNIQIAKDRLSPDMNTAMWFCDNGNKNPHEIKREGYQFLSYFGVRERIKSKFIEYYDRELILLLRKMGYANHLFKSHHIFRDKHAANKVSVQQKQKTEAQNLILQKQAESEQFIGKRSRSIHLFTAWYKARSESRQNELLSCLNRNLDNPYIDKVYVMAECELPLEHDKLQVIRSLRPTMMDMVEISNLHSGDVNIMCNSDIYFDQSISMCRDLDLKQKVLCLSRWEQSGRHYDYEYSQDSWIWEGKLNLQGGDYHFGLLGCDNKLAHDLFTSGYTVLNPSRHIRSWHLHNTNERSYYESTRLPRPYRNVPVCGLENLKIPRVLVHQPGKMGDIIIVLPICKYYADQGFEVELMCPEQYHVLNTYIDYCKFVSSRTGFYEKDIDLSFGIITTTKVHALWLRRKPQLDSFVTLKYELSGVPLSERHNLHYTRNEKREQELFNILGLSDNEPYVLFHGQSDYGTPVNPPLTDLRVVEFKPVGDYTVFDWREVIEKASEIHCIDSCLANFVEVIEVPAKKIFYRVPQRTTESLYDFNNKWELICT